MPLTLDRLNDSTQAAFTALLEGTYEHSPWIAEAAWAGVLGCHLLSSAIGDDPYSRLARAWRSLMLAMLPEEIVGDYLRLIDDCASRYQRVG